MWRESEASNKPPRNRALPALAIAVTLILIALACSGSDGGDGSAVTPGAATTIDDDTPPDISDALPLMVIQEVDLPPGIQPVSQGFTTNEDLIRASSDPESEREKLDRQGRLLSHSVTFQPGPDVIAETPTRGVNATASLYETAAGAAESYAQAEADANERDWQADSPELSEFQVRRIELDTEAEELLWLRLSGFSTAPEGIVVDDVILFRVGRARGFLRVLAIAPGEDRDLMLGEVEGWIRTQVRRVTEALAAGIEP